jgi:hypothetical protein
MSVQVNLTSEQKAFSEHHDAAFVIACPGAGKTETIITRLVEIAKTLPQRRALAVLSFTNSAVDEFQCRCRKADIEYLLAFPHFMGTVDSFVRNFIVLPACAREIPTRPIVVDSWKSLDVEIRLSGSRAFRGDGVSLDSFDADTNVIDPAGIKHAALRNHVTLNRLAYQSAAQTRRTALRVSGYLSAADARVETLRLMHDPRRSESLGRALAGRFFEVIVDEGQDCNPLDFEILQWLRTYNIRVTFMCDPDQAIYGFRHGDPDGLLTFQRSYPLESQLRLSGNLRSSQIICSLAATLRSTGKTDDAIGECASLNHPVILLSYSDRLTSSIGKQFVAKLEQYGVPLEKAMVLGHAAKSAQRAISTVIAEPSNGSSRVEALAKAVASFWFINATSRSRERAVCKVETLLLDLMRLRQDGEHIIKTFQRTNLDVRLHRRRAIALIMELPKLCSHSDAGRLAWVTAVQAAVEKLRLEIPQGQSVRNFFRCPSGDGWSLHLQESIEPRLNCSTIHEAKGRQYDAVCVVVPPNRAPDNYSENLFSVWEQGLDHESKRVVYVGVTRARRLAVLAIPAVYVQRGIALLRRGNVPFLHTPCGTDENG